MARKGINREQVVKAAQEISFNNKLPTSATVRAKLGTGSVTTIQKYLQEWKINCYKNFELNVSLDAKTDPELSEKCRTLEQALNKQTTQNEHYASELINAEKANIALKEENRQLQIATKELQLSLSTAEATNNALDKVTQKVQSQLNLNTQATIQKMQQTIDNLRAELKNLNETSITALRETSTKGHETIMQEKVTIVNLQAKVDNLNKEFLESKKQLNEALIVNQVQARTLSRQIEWQQKIIQEYIAVDCLRHPKEELDLQTATTMVGTYGK